MGHAVGGAGARGRGGGHEARLIMHREQRQVVGVDTERVFHLLPIAKDYNQSDAHRIGGSGYNQSDAHRIGGSGYNQPDAHRIGGKKLMGLSIGGSPRGLSP